MKNLFNKKQLLACAAVLFMMSSCVDPLEMDIAEAEMTVIAAKNETATTTPPKKRKLGAGSQDDEIGSMRANQTEEPVDATTTSEEEKVNN